MKGAMNDSKMTLTFPRSKLPIYMVHRHARLNILSGLLYNEPFFEESERFVCPAEYTMQI